MGDMVCLIVNTTADFYQDALNFGAGLLNLGLKNAEPVELLSDNRREWYNDSVVLSL